MTNECSSLMNTRLGEVSQFAAHLRLSKTAAATCIFSKVLSILAVRLKYSDRLMAVCSNGPTAIDPNSVYEYVAKTGFTVKPLIPMTNVVFVKDIPGLGQPVQITWTAARATEFVGGLASSASSTSGPGSSLKPLPQVTPPTPTYLGALGC